MYMYPPIKKKLISLRFFRRDKTLKPQYDYYISLSNIRPKNYQVFLVGCVADTDCDPPNSFCDATTCQCSQTACPLKWTNGELVRYALYLKFQNREMGAYSIGKEVPYCAYRLKDTGTVL